MRQKFEHIKRLLESSNPSICLYSEKIEEYFSKLTHSPDHPPYASMILRAIAELNEQGGSSEETISKFIKAEHENLPIAHATQLTRHLQRLVTKGEIVSTSANCYMLFLENSDSLCKLKKEHGRPRRHGRNRQNIRQHNFKGIQLQERIIEESREQNQVHLKISKGFKEQNQADVQQIGSIGEQKKQGLQLIVEVQNEVEELQLKVVEDQIQAEQDGEGNEEHDQMQEQQNQQLLELNLQGSQILSETSDVIIEENCQAAGSNLAQKSSGATEAEHQKEPEDEVIVEVYHKEQKSKKLEEKNEIKNQESKVGDKQAQLPDIQIEEMMEQRNQETLHFEVSEEKDRLWEQKVEVCRQIIDLSNMLLQFIKKDKEDIATTSTHNYVMSQEVDLSGSSLLTKEEFIELLKKTNKAEGKLIDIISSLDLEVSENNNSMPKMGGQEELLDKHLVQTENPCRGNETVLACDFQPKQPQQLENCGQIKVANYQPKIVSASVNLPTDSRQLMQNQQIKPSSHKRPPEFETTTLEELSEKQNKQMKLCGQEEAPQSQPNSMEIGLVVPCDSPDDENDNTQLVIQRIEAVLDDDSITSEPNIKFSGEAAISTPKTDKSYLDVSLYSEQLNNTELCEQEEVCEPRLVTSSLSVPMEIQELDLEHQQRNTFSNKQPENPIEGRYIEHELVSMEHLPQVQQQMVGRGQRTQLQSLSENPSKSQPDTGTRVEEQCDQTMEKQQQLRQLRPRGPRSSKSESIRTIFEADNDLTLSSLKSRLKRKLRPSILKSPKEQQRNLHGQKKPLKSQPTTLTFGSIIISKQQSNGRLQRPLKPQGEDPLQSDSVVQKTREEPFPFRHQQRGQEQLQLRRRGRPPKLKLEVDTAMGGSMALNHHHNGQHKSQRQGRGRPPKPKANADITMEGSLLSNKQKCNDRQPRHRQRGRPLKSNVVTTTDLIYPSPQQHEHPEERAQGQGRGHPLKLRKTAASALESSLPSQHKG